VATKIATTAFGEVFVRTGVNHAGHEQGRKTEQLV